MLIDNAFFKNLKRGTEELNYGRNIITDWSKENISNKNEINVLDLGLGVGTDLINIKNQLSIKVNLYGIESYPPNVKKARENGIRVSEFNMEKTEFPYESQHFDIVIANQILEHTKEIIWIFSEVSRILKRNGIFICGVPNLASLHNRILLICGEQPTSIRVLGPHVRGYVKKSFLEFAEADGYFKVIDFKGSGFYPFPKRIACLLSDMFPNMAVSSFYLIKRTEKEGLYRDVLKSRFFETPYFIGV